MQQIIRISVGHCVYEQIRKSVYSRQRTEFDCVTLMSIDSFETFFCKFFFKRTATQIYRYVCFRSRMLGTISQTRWA